MNLLEKLTIRVYASGIRLVRRAHEHNGWYGAANAVLGLTSLTVGTLCLMTWMWGE